ncbi:MAG: hypothetical protein HF314_01280 [Ignavibacteria bacterium]|jgi:hypothetical protein|nr:hypothetical protein [Ignavibacteria bacterium]MCU7501675.1 hypothetical protein [Ignavibacteria bacterium]MCU7517736.1 hypothetical protein [Ignavibacteria bacterium]
MYKILIFLKKVGDESVLTHFRDVTIPKLESLVKSKVPLADIEGSALSEEKYHKYCEAVFSKKEDLDRLFQSPEGKEFNKELAGLGRHISVFYANFGG